MSNVTRVIVLAVALAAALTVSGPTQTRAQEAVLLEAGQDSILIALNEQNDSGQSGWATLTAMDDQTEVVLNLSAGDLETELVHIHTGSCGDSLVGVVYGLTSFVDGSGESTTIIDASLASLRTGATAVNSHEGDNAGNYTSCGNIPTVGDSITIALNEQNDSAQSG